MILRWKFGISLWISVRANLPLSLCTFHCSPSVLGSAAAWMIATLFRITCSGEWLLKIAFFTGTICRCIFWRIFKTIQSSAMLQDSTWQVSQLADRWERVSLHYKMLIFGYFHFDILECQQVRATRLNTLRPSSPFRIFQYILENWLREHLLDSETMLIGLEVEPHLRRMIGKYDEVASSIQCPFLVGWNNGDQS